MLRHPADGSQWRKVDRTFPTFANNARNIRFGLSTDGMNPFGEQSRRHDHYGGKADHRTKPRHRCGKMVFEMVKDIKVVFGKGPGSRSVQSDDGRAPMWKKRVFFVSYLIGKF